MSAVKRERAHWFSLFLMLAMVFTVVTENRAEAFLFRRGMFRRRCCFGRRFNPAPRRRVARCCGRPSRGGGFNPHFNQFNNFGRDALARQAVDPFSNLALDPSGDLSRLAGLGGGRGLRMIGNSNLAVNERGEFFEQVDRTNLSTDRPLIFNDGKILGGAVVPLRNDTLEQVRQFNASGALNAFHRR
jgi:hypothetical protein